MSRLRPAIAPTLLAVLGVWIGSVACQTQPGPIFSGGGSSSKVTLRNVTSSAVSLAGPCETMGAANVVQANGRTNTRSYSFKGKSGDVLTFSANPGGQTVTVDCTETGSTPFSTAAHLAEVVLQPNSTLSCSGW